MMARRQLQYANKHRREQETTRRRFIVLLGVLMAMLVSVGIAECYLAVRASSTVQVSGRVYNVTTGSGYAGVAVYLCNGNGTVTSDASGAFHQDLLPGAVFCVRVTNFPFSKTGITGPRALNINSTLGSQPSYENQVAGVNCYSNTSCTAVQRQWDRNFAGPNEGGYDLAYAGNPAQSSAAAAKPQQQQPVSAQGAGPTVPGNFQATVAASNSAVALSWSASSASAGIKDYVIDRSVDQSTWTAVAANVTSTSYQDGSVDFGVHYYYRIKAVDQAGGSSGYASTDASTGDFQNSGDSSAAGGTTVSSDDGVVTVDMPDGSYEGEVDCTMTLVGNSGGSGLNPVAAGPYSLLCKTLAGQQVTDFNKAVAWTYNLRGKLAGLNNPVAFSFPGGGNPKAVAGQQYDAASGILKFSTTTSDTTEVLASKVQGVSINLVTAILVVIVIMFGLAILVVRRSQRFGYDEYLRRKYYNL
jgi:hypothetical protein